MAHPLTFTYLRSSPEVLAFTKPAPKWSKAFKKLKTEPNETVWSRQAAKNSYFVPKVKLSLRLHKGRGVKKLEQTETFAAILIST